MPNTMFASNSCITRMNEKQQYKRHPPSIRQLEAFLAIETTRNVTAAAERLHISQSALSRTLQQIEEAMGQTLFDRHTRSVDLNNAGRAMLPVAKQLVGEYYDSFGRLLDRLDGGGGRIVMAGLPSAVIALMPRAVRRFSAEWPNVEIKLMCLLEEEVLEVVRSGEADFGIVSALAAASWFEFDELLRDEYMLVCHPEDELAKKTSVSWRALTTRPFVGLANSRVVRPELDRIFVKLKIQIDVRYECDNIMLIGPMIAAGLGITVLPRLALTEAKRFGLAVVPLEGLAARRVIGLINRSDAALSPAARRLVEALKEELTQPAL